MSLNGSLGVPWYSEPCRFVIMRRTMDEAMKEALLGMRAAFRIVGAPVLPEAGPATFQGVATVSAKAPPRRRRIGFVVDD